MGVAGLVWILGLVAVQSHYTRDPLEHSAVGTFAVARADNPSDDSVWVAVLAPRVDSAIRPLGVLGPHEWGWARLPYDTPPLVFLYLTNRGGWWHTIQPDSIFYADTVHRPADGPAPDRKDLRRVDFLWPDVTTVPLTPEAWRRSPWYRLEDDPSTPVMVIVSGVWACVLRTTIVNVPRLGDFFQCPHEWRASR